jgi:hypothetical protein
VNLAPELVALALTLAIVERIIGRESLTRVRPLIEVAMDWMAHTIRTLTAAIAADYAETHLDNYQPLPDDVLGILKHWEAEEKNADAERVIDESGLPELIKAGESHMWEVERIRRDYADHLDANLVLSFDALWHGLRTARSTAAVADMRQDPEGRRRSVAIMVRGMLLFATEFGKHGRLPTLTPEDRLEIEDARDQAMARRHEKPDG